MGLFCKQKKRKKVKYVSCSCMYLMLKYTVPPHDQLTIGQSLDSRQQGSFSQAPQQIN